jgi:hypothetical protein
VALAIVGKSVEAREAACPLWVDPVEKGLVNIDES